MSKVYSVVWSVDYNSYCVVEDISPLICKVIESGLQSKSDAAIMRELIIESDR